MSERRPAEPHRAPAEDEGLLRRWSRRKAESRHPETEAPAGSPVVPDGEARNAAGAPETEVPNLPDIESLTAESDFRVFMAKGVPDEVRNRALRKLWRLKPSLANLDGLVDYGHDYTRSATVVAGLKTAYQVGKGYLERIEGQDERRVAAAEPDAAGPAPEAGPDAAGPAAEKVASEPGDAPPGDAPVPEDPGRARSDQPEEPEPERA